MTRIVEGATRVAALVSHVLLSVLVVFSAAGVMHPGPGTAWGRHVVALCGFSLLLWVFVGGEMRATRLLGFREPDWVMIPRFGVMAVGVLLAGRFVGATALQGLTTGVVAFAALRSLFHALVVVHQRIEGEDGAPLGPSEDSEDTITVEIPPVLMTLLLAIGPVVSLYLDLLHVLYGAPNHSASESA